MRPLIAEEDGPGDVVAKVHGWLRESSLLPRLWRRCLHTADAKFDVVAGSFRSSMPFGEAWGSSNRIASL